MALRESIGLICVVSASALSGIAGDVRADEAYLCGPDTVVYVKAQDLELKKRTDPCIAAYYGLTLDEARPTPVAVSKTKQAALTLPATVAKAPVIKLKSTVELDKADRTPVRPTQQAALVPPVASPGTDYRNVRVINASSADGMWFRHDK